MYFRYLTFSCPGQTKFIHSTEKKRIKKKKIRDDCVWGVRGRGDAKGGMQGTLSEGHSGFMFTLFHLVFHHRDEHDGFDYTFYVCFTVEDDNPGGTHHITRGWKTLPPLQRSS